MKKPCAGPTTEKDRRCQNQRFQQQLRREQTDEGEKRETDQHESARQKNIRAVQNFRCRTDQLQIENKEKETAAAADRADSAGDPRQHACQDRRTEIYKGLQTFDEPEPVHQQNSNDQSSEQHDQPIRLDTGKDPDTEADPRHHAEGEDALDRLVRMAEPLGKKMNLGEPGCQGKQKDRLMRAQHPGRQ